MNEQKTGSDIEKLKFVLPCLLKHNKEHTKDIEKWFNKTGQAGLEEITKELKKVAELSKQINECFKSAIKKLGE